MGGGGSRGKNKGVSSSSGSTGELYLVTSAEGKLQLIGKNGRLEKTVEAHRYFDHIFDTYV